MNMNYADLILHLRKDGLYVEAFCQKYKAQLIDVFPNTEDFPPRGLMYEFDNQLGGYSITGIKRSLDQTIDDTIVDQDEWQGE